MPSIDPDGRRAVTDMEKRAFISTLLQAWKRHPHLRLGQLIENAIAQKANRLGEQANRVFYVEDLDLIQACDEFK